MREVEQALARVYGRREATGPRQAPPHSSSPVSPAPAAPPPHFRMGEPRGLSWPATVRALEREHGARFERLADHLVDLRDRQKYRILLFTSCHRAEGRTTLVLTLARALARRPGRTLVVDADLTGPMLANLLDIRPRVGLDDVVQDDAPLAEALIEAPDDHLTFLPLRGPVARPRDFLASPGWACTMARLRREFDLILLDGSPMFTGLSAAVLHRSVDAAVLVYHHELTGERSLHRAQEVLEAGGVPLLGLAETFAAEAR